MAAALNGLRPFVFQNQTRKALLKFAVHPATRLVSWLLLLVAVQSLSGLFLAGSFLVTPLLGVKALRRGGQLIWRTRWLLLSLLVIFPWGIAGQPLWNGAGAPTQEGVQEALTHLGRLLLVLMVVAAFLEAMPLPDLLAATHSLLKPLRGLGLDPERGVVRLMLVLHYVETLPRPRDWRTLLDAPSSMSNEQVEVSHQPLRCSDYGLMLVFVTLVFTLYMFRVVS